MARDLLPVIREALQGLFAVEREIARGGAARVYRAEDAQGRLVALKVLHPELQVSAMAERFLREIRLASSLDHPLIAPVLDWGQKDWLVYYTMPLITGPTLRTCLSRSKLSIDDARRVALDVLSALEHAHAAQIMHRDVKPENIIISGSGAVLVDFGVARAVEVAAGEKVTAAGMTVGTAGYMSPEQATGAEDLDSRTDLYAVGCVLFEALAGRPPFAHRNQSMVMQLQMTSDAPDVRTFRPDTPPALAEVVNRALQRRADDRWRTAGEMRASLEGGAA